MDGGGGGNPRRISEPACAMQRLCLRALKMGMRDTSLTVVQGGFNGSVDDNWCALSGSYTEGSWLKALLCLISSPNMMHAHKPWYELGFGGALILGFEGVRLRTARTPIEPSRCAQPPVLNFISTIHFPNGACIRMHARPVVVSYILR